MTVFDSLHEECGVFGILDHEDAGMMGIVEVVD